MNKIEELRERLAEINNRCQDLKANAEAEKRDLSADEEKELESLLNEFDTVTARIETLSRLESQTERLNASTRKTEPAKPAQALAAEDDVPPMPKRPGFRVPAEPIKERKAGFRHLGEMAYHVRRACLNGGVMDPRLQRLASATTYGSEAAGADGGFAVPPDFREAIMVQVLGEDSLLSRCDQITTDSNTFTCPKDETTPWQSSGGVLAYWDGEASAATQSKPSLQEINVKLNKLRALVPMTEELLEDASALDTYLRRKAPEKIAFKVSLAIVQGLGVGTPLGILNSPALVSVAKESSQTADTLIARNVIKMYSRMYAPSRSKAVWLINQDIEPELFKLALPGTDNVGNAVTGWGTSVYMPPGGVSSSPYATLFGRPVIATQACETLGDLGDILFVDLSQYLALLKSGPNPRVETSIHLWFDQDITAFKFVLRMGGQPWWSTTIAARDGSNTYSPFVALAERA